MKMLHGVLFAILTAVAVQHAASQDLMPGSVRGNLQSSESPEPLAGGIVELRDANANGAPKAVVLSDDKGAFAFSNVAPGRYRIFVTRNGFASRQGPLVVVSPGQNVSVMPMILVPGASVSGRVLSSNGDPMPIVAVSIVKAGYGDDGHPSFTEIALQITNDQGEFRFFWLPAGTFYLRAVNARSNMQTTILLNPNGNGARTGAGVLTSPRTTARVTSDPGLNEDQTYVEVFYPGTADRQAAIPLELRPGSELRSINITMNPKKLIRVRGVAVNPFAQQSMQETVVASIRSIDTSSGEPGSPLSYLQFNRGGGEFEFSDVFSGTYEVRVSAGGLTGRAIVDIRGQDVDVQVPLLPPVTLTGRLKSLSGPVDFTGVRVGVSANGVAASAEGDFLIPNVAASIYSMIVKFPASLPDAYVQSIRFRDIDITDSFLIVDGTPPPPLELDINTAGGSIDGRTSNSQGDLITGATVLLVPAQPASPRPNLFRNEVADESGRFQFHALPPGDYFLYAWTDIEKNSWFDPAFLHNYESTRQAIHIASGEKQSLTINVSPMN